MPSYYRWSLNRDIPLILILQNADGTGATGLSPTVTIRRDADDQYWDGAVFTATPTTIPMAEFDATNNPGLYVHTFANSSLAVPETYRMYYSHQAALPRGIDAEVHIVSAEIVQGASQVTLRTEDDLGNPVVGAQVDIYDATNTIFINRYATDVNGEVVVALDDATYNLRIFAMNVAFTVPEVIVVAGDGTFVITGVLGAGVALPSAPNLCVIFGTIHSAGGVDMVGVCVQAFAVTDPAQAVDGSQLGDLVAETTTDQDGFFELELIRTAVVQFIVEEAGVNFIRTVPDAPKQDLTTWT